MEEVRNDSSLAVGQSQEPKGGYNAPGNQFERFRVFLDLISRFEFDFRRCEIFLF